MRRILLAATLLAVHAAQATPIQVAAPVKREVVGQRTAENIPPIPPQITHRLSQYQATRGAGFAGWLRDGSLLITTRFAETAQAHRVRSPMGMREQLTFFPEPITQVQSAPATGGNGFVFAQDVGGSEFWQLHWYDLDTRSVSLLSDGGNNRNERPLFAHDGQQIAFSSTARNGTDTDVWVRNIATGAARPVVTAGGAWYPADFSHDGTKLLVLKYVSINESYPGEVDLATGKLRLFPVDGGKAAFTTFQYAKDGSVFYVSDEGTQFRTLRHHDPKGGAPTQVSADVPWDVTGVVQSDDGGLLAFSSNEDGVGKLHVRRLPGLEPVALPPLPVGVIGGFGFSPDGTQLAVTLNSATSPSDVYVIGLAATTLTRWTQSEVGGLDASRFVAPSLVRYPTFDQVDGKPRTIPAFYYRPPGSGPFPVVVQIHGGPEAQALPAFNPSIQYLVNEAKIAVLVPNVRGSAGYGKDYLLLDNGEKREDSVKDIGALLDWIATQPELDADRVGVSGGSYGGYMVLASMTHYNDRLRAGVDVVGISSFTTFLKNTQGYRRDLRRAEYGDERDPAMHAFHEQIAPLNNAQKITKPLFVAQGANDPRVPASEAEQIVSKVRGNGGDVWYLLFGDEGHGFAKKTNADYFGAAQMLFWQTHLLGE